MKRGSVELWIGIIVRNHLVVLISVICGVVEVEKWIKQR